MLRGKYLVDAIGFNKVRGLPFKAEELAEVIATYVDTNNANEGSSNG